MLIDSEHIPLEILQRPRSMLVDDAGINLIAFVHRMVNRSVLAWGLTESTRGMEVTALGERAYAQDIVQSVSPYMANLIAEAYNTFENSLAYDSPPISSMDDIRMVLSAMFNILNEEGEYGKRGRDALAKLAAVLEVDLLPREGLYRHPDLHKHLQNIINAHEAMLRTRHPDQYLDMELVCTALRKECEHSSMGNPSTIALELDNAAKIILPLTWNLLGENMKLPEYMNTAFWEKISHNLNKTGILRNINAMHNWFLIALPKKENDALVRKEDIQLLYSFYYHLHNPADEYGRKHRASIEIFFKDAAIGPVLEEEKMLQKDSTLILKSAVIANKQQMERSGRQ